MIFIWRQENIFNHEVGACLILSWKNSGKIMSPFDGGRSASCVNCNYERWHCTVMSKTIQGWRHQVCVHWTYTTYYLAMYSVVTSAVTHSGMSDESVIIYQERLWKPISHFPPVCRVILWRQCSCKFEGRLQTLHGTLGMSSDCHHSFLSVV